MIISIQVVRYFIVFCLIWFYILFQPESDGSRSGSSLSLRNLTGPDAVSGGNSQVQSPTHRRVHRSISATSTNPSRRASSGGETLRMKIFSLIFFY
jgi:MAP/microtubule affinity-regulating kinase